MIVHMVSALFQIMPKLSTEFLVILLMIIHMVSGAAGRPGADFASKHVFYPPYRMIAVCCFFPVFLSVFLSIVNLIFAIFLNRKRYRLHICYAYLTDDARSYEAKVYNLMTLTLTFVLL